MAIPRRRISTYKTTERAKRAFYKFVFKNGLHGPHYRYGVPLFNATRSRAREIWEEAGRDRLEERHRDETEKLTAEIHRERNTFTAWIEAQHLHRDIRRFLKQPNQ